jgi:type IV pilus assembly protein PilW
LTHRPLAAPGRRAQRGLSLVELMVGIAVGLFVVAAAAMLVSTQLNENRRLLLETQVHQDLRAAADIVTRELRRAGYWPAAAQSVWTPGGGVSLSPHLTVSPTAAAATQVDFDYRRATGETGPFGFRRDGGILKTRLGAAGWQDLTDGNTLRVTGFAVTPRFGPPVRLPCPKLCPDGSTDCWPTLTVRELVVDIAGHAVSDPSVERSLRTVVRLRNDWVRFNAAAAQACPA